MDFCVIVGENFTCQQMTNIALNKEPCRINIGNNVTLGCGAVILGSGVNIGNNVTIGAIYFVNKDILDNCAVYTEKTN